MIYSFPGRIRYSEVGEDGRLTLYSLINYFQDCSTFHAEDSAVGMGWMAERHMAWVLAAWQIRVEEYPALGDRVKTSTWAYGFRGCLGYRNYSLEGEDGRRLAIANSEWVLMDLQRGRMIKVPEELANAYGIEADHKLREDLGPRKIEVPLEGHDLPSFTVQEYHLDTNHHVNNGQYVRMAAACLPPEFQIGRMRAEYKGQAHLGDRIYPRVSQAEEGYLVSLHQEDGSPYFVAELRG